MDRETHEAEEAAEAARPQEPRRLSPTGIRAMQGDDKGVSAPGDGPDARQDAAYRAAQDALAEQHDEQDVLGRRRHASEAAARATIGDGAVNSMICCEHPHYFSFAPLDILYYNAMQFCGNQGGRLETDTVSRKEPESLEPEDVSLGRAFGGRSALRDVLEVIFLTLAIFLVVNTLTGRFQVRGSSMEPSLHNGQYVIVGKLVYRFQEPQRGDVVVFEPPNGASEDYIKRVIGVPGDRVEVHDGAVWVNGYRLEESYLASPMAYSGSWELGADEYFVLGDNRANSSDSHSWGPLARDRIVGKAWVSYWPPQHWGVIRHYRFPELDE